MNSPLLHDPRQRVRALELLVFSAGTLWALQVATKEGYALSLQFENQGKYSHLASGLWPGWILGRSCDLSDIQWREFRSKTGLLSACFTAFVTLSHVVRILDPQRRSLFYLSFAAILLVVLHGFCVIYIIVLLLWQYYLTKILVGKRHGLICMWAWSCATLLAARLLEGLPFANISSRLSWMDAHRGVLRWHISYNMLLLRCISFSADCLWASAHAAAKAALKEGAGSTTARAEVVLRPEQYSLTSFLVYALYAPLYIAGPTMTFNNFTAQLEEGRTPQWKQVGLYALRLASACIVLEVMTHHLYPNAIARFRLWQRVEAQEGQPLPPLQLALVGFWVLVFMWLKFLVMWRFFRLWALADGFEPPENMLRCVCNNYDIEGFWRNWHASYNQWLVRYLYIPLGGRRWRALNVWAIFTFVAIWHDLEWRLLRWAWIMALLFAPELGCKWLAAQPWLEGVRQSGVWHRICAVAASINIVLLMSANLVGFVLDVDGAATLLRTLLQQPHLMLGVFVSLFCATHLMFALRRWEASRGGSTKRQHSH